MKCILEFPTGHEIKVTKNSNVVMKQKFNISLTNEIPINILELDSRVSLFAEYFSAPLLLPFKLRCDSEQLKAHVMKIANAYRKRTVLEQAYDLYVRLGPLLETVKILPTYFPLSRLNLVWKINACFLLNLINENNKEELINKLNKTYSEYLSKTLNARIEKGYVKLKPPTIKENFISFMTSFKLALQTSLHKFATNLLRLKGDECEPPDFIKRPWIFIKVPEGQLKFSCPQPKAVVGGSCRALSSLSESLICNSKNGNVVVKDYYRITTVKWIPATLASNIYGIKYRFGAKSRLSAEVKYFPILRHIISTPSILKICIDYRQAYTIREYIEGDPLNKIKDPKVWREVGRKLAKIHKSGFFLGDPNPGNFVFDHEGNFWLIDAEQVRRLTDPSKMKAWDVIVFLFYSTFLDIDERLVKEALRGYASDTNDWREIRREAMSPQVWASLGVAVPNLLKTQKLIKEVNV